MLIGVAVLAGAVATTTLATGCLPWFSRGAAPAVSDEEMERREAAGQNDLRKAKKANTEQAYRLVMKRHPETRAFKEALSMIAGMRADEAKVALSKGERDKARMLANEAIEHGDDGVRARARIVLKRMEQEDAGKIGEACAEALKAGNTPETCATAVKIVAEALGNSPSPIVLEEVRGLTQKPLTACVQALIDGVDALGVEAMPAAYGAARKVVEAPATAKAVGDDTVKTLATALNDRAGKALQSVTQEDIKKGRWEVAGLAIRAWADAGALTQKQAESARGALREVVTKDVMDRGKAALGKPGAEPVLAEVERGVKLLASAAPQELKTLQAQLALWIQCSKLACTAAPKPKPMFNFGTAPVFPLDNPRGEASETVANATKLWVLATGGKLSLIAKDNPGDPKTWPEKLAAAKGWIETSVLQAEDTSEWLPLGKGLEGLRVWLPTGRQDGLYQLGIVQTVDGKDANVKKMADGQVVAAKRDVLRVGSMKAGLKVLAYCVDPQNPVPARFEEVVPNATGHPVARVTCLTADGKDDKSRNELIGALRSKPEWLPPRKP